MPYHLELRSAFGTSHSSTSHRTNALVQLSIVTLDQPVCEKLPLFGYGEIGLPPKKKNCYLADYDDIHSFFTSFGEELIIQSGTFSDISMDVFTQPFAGLPAHQFKKFRQAVTDTNHRRCQLTLLAMLHHLDVTPLKAYECYHAAKCGLEMAIFDYWCKVESIPLYELLGLQSREEKRSMFKKGFYTAAINPDIGIVVEVVRAEAAETTRYLKIKINSDISFVAELLFKLNEEFPFDAETGRDWVLDANAAWNTDVMSAFVEIIRPFCHRIYMLEQPFPLDFLSDALPEELSKWIDLKNIYNRDLDILLFADESMCTWQDVERLLPFINGVNIKLEKTGGFRGALMAANAATALGLQIWCGVMVGSPFGSTATSHLIELVSEGADLDGSLLVTESSSLFSGGVIWKDSVQYGQPFGFIGWPLLIPGGVVGIGCIPNTSEPLIPLPLSDPI